MACDNARCALRDPASLGAERRWVRNVLASELFENARPSDAVLEAFNDHIALAGCATPSLTRNADGTVGRGFQSSTLRGQLHAFLVDGLADLAGDLLHANVTTKSVTDLRARAEEAKRVWRDRDRARVRLLHAAGESNYSIQRRTGYSLKRIRAALKDE